MHLSDNERLSLSANFQHPIAIKDISYKKTQTIDIVSILNNKKNDRIYQPKNFKFYVQFLTKNNAETSQFDSKKSVSIWIQWSNPIP